MPVPVHVYWARHHFDPNINFNSSTTLLLLFLKTSYSGLIESYQAKIKEGEEKATELSNRLIEKDAEIEELKQKASEYQLKIVGIVALAVDGWFHVRASLRLIWFLSPLGKSWEEFQYLIRSLGWPRKTSNCVLKLKKKRLNADKATPESRHLRNRSNFFNFFFGFMVHTVFK